MAKLKSFEEYIADIDSAEEIENDVMDMGEPDTAEGDDEVTSNDQEKGGVEVHDAEKGKEVGVEPEDMEAPLETGEEDQHVGGEPVDTDPKDISDEIEGLEDESDEDSNDVDESTVSEDDSDDDDEDDSDDDDEDDSDEDDEDDDEDDSDEDDEDDSDDKASSEAPKKVEDILKEAYEAVCSEAKAWEADMHDEHTIESYLKENAALVAGLAMNALKEMKEEMTLEIYEAHCNELKEAYAKKMDELKEAWGAEGE